MSKYRDLIKRPCICGHLYGDHAPTAPHRCLNLDRRNHVLFGLPRCTCVLFREPKDT